MDSKSENYNVKKLGEMIKDIRVAMLTTTEKDGTLRSRPMMTQEEEFDGDLWFITSAVSPKVNESENMNYVNVSYSKPEDERFVSVSGTAELVRDREKIRELWSPAYKSWFPEGENDPDLALLRVNVEEAEYWDANSGKMVQIAGFVKALAGGQNYPPVENQKLDFREEPQQLTAENSKGENNG